MLGLLWCNPLACRATVKGRQSAGRSQTGTGRLCCRNVPDTGSALPQDELVRVGMSEMLIGRCLHYLQQQGDVELVRGRRMIHRIR